MKTLKDLFELVAVAVEQNRTEGICKKHWFVSFSGHVNRISIKYYFAGWREDDAYNYEKIEETLNADGIQAAYWFIKTRLNK